MVIGINSTINIFKQKGSSFQRFTSNNDIGDESINSISVLNPNLILIARSHGLETFDLLKNNFNQISSFNDQIVYDLISFENILGIDSLDDEFGIVEDGKIVIRFISFILSNKGLFKIYLDESLNGCQ